MTFRLRISYPPTFYPPPGTPEAIARGWQACRCHQIRRLAGSDRARRSALQRREDLPGSRLKLIASRKASMSLTMRDAEPLAIQRAHFPSGIIRSDGDISRLSALDGPTGGCRQSRCLVPSIGSTRRSEAASMVPNGECLPSRCVGPSASRHQPGRTRQRRTHMPRPLKRLEVLGYIRRVEFTDRPISCSVIALLGVGRQEGSSSGLLLSGRAGGFPRLRAPR